MNSLNGHALGIAALLGASTRCAGKTFCLSEKGVLPEAGASTSWAPHLVLRIAPNAYRSMTSQHCRALFSLIYI